MAIEITQDEFQVMWSGDPLTDTEWKRTSGLLRRAERELALIVGPLDQIPDVQLVKDTLIDAVIESQLIDNPNHYRSESDGGYSYSRFTLPSGRASRFWWPQNLLELFGRRVDDGKLRMLRARPSRLGWVQ